MTIYHLLPLLRLDHVRRPGFGLPHPHKKIPEPDIPFQGFLDA
jgi:hypothetical protein